MRSIIQYLTESKEERIPLTTEEMGMVKKKFGNNLECSFAKNKIGEYYCYTHRTRSKYYKSIGEIPKATVKFVGSTGWIYV